MSRFPLRTGIRPGAELAICLQPGSAPPGVPDRSPESHEMRGSHRLVVPEYRALILTLGYDGHVMPAVMIQPTIPVEGSHWGLW
ncbi:MAG TPA: hypothetical protein VE136_18035 [Anaerolineales bacterium]|nr:hypothetical protein [Anaerolineales bacterium]